MNIDKLREFAMREIVFLLDSFPGTKDLVLDYDLLQILERVAGVALLKQCGVENIMKLENKFNSAGNSRRIYLVRPEIHKTKIIAEHINADKSRAKRFLKLVVVAMVPRKLYCCEEVLEFEGVYGDVVLRSCDIGFIPLDNGVLSLELPQFNQDFFLFQDQTWIHSIASSLHKLEKHYGSFPIVYAQGQASKLVYEMLKNVFEKTNERSRLPEQSRSPSIGYLFLIDRDVDYTSALMSPLTYEGQLDETFTIKNGYIQFDSEECNKTERIKLKLSNEDTIFQEIRDTHIAKAFEILSTKVKELVSNSKKRREMSVTEMSTFVKTKLKSEQEEHKSVSRHIAACESIFRSSMLDKVQERITVERNIIEGVSYKDSLNFVEDLIILKSPITLTLRLLCLLSLSQDGLTQKDYLMLRTRFLQSYGHKHLLTFYSLRKMNLCTEQEHKPVTPLSTKLVEKVASAAVHRVAGSSFHSVGKKLNLIPKPDDDYDAKNPSDPSYVYGGVYIPLACNFIMQILQNNDSTKLEDILKLPLGPSVSEIRATSARGSGGHSSIDQSSRPASRIVLVMFLGGITVAEVAAFKMLERLTRFQFVLTATSMISGNKLIEATLEK